MPGWHLSKELDDQDSETEEEAQDEGPAPDNDLRFDVDDIEVEEGDHVFMAMVHPVDPQHFIRASCTVSRHLAEALAKNSMPKGVTPKSGFGYVT
jgi:hypothetical protein